MATQPKAYTYKDLKWVDIEIFLNAELESKACQARKDYDNSKGYINDRQYWIWRYAMKAYHLSTFDRKMAINQKAWQSNIAIGLVRSFVDVLVASVEEKPLTFIGTPINQKGLENKDNILKALDYVSDVTGFHRTIKQCLKNWLILGTIALRVNYLKTTKKTKVTSIIDQEAIQTVVEVNDEEVKDYPCATSVSVFNIFPDPYPGRLRYVTERGVMSYYEVMSTFGNMIKRKDNLSPFKSESFLQALPLEYNKNQADFLDYGIIVDQIYQKVNEELREKDKYGLQTNATQFSTSTNSSLTQDQDSAITEGLIEFKYTVYDDRIVLHFNNYPVYIGPNFYWFINYVIKAAGDDSIRFGEGIPFMLRGLEEVATSFINNYFDGARALATPTFVAVKNLLLNESQLESWQPGWTIWIEWWETANAVRRLDKWGLNSFDIYPLITQIAQQITGISEYNLGQSAGERTATGALSVSESSTKRMSPYISTFIDAISVVAQMWLSLMKKNWTKEQWIYVLDDQGNQTFQALHNTDLTGWINLSLQAEWLFGSTNALELQKLIQVYQTLAPGGAVKAWAIASEIIKKAWFTPSRFVINPEQVKPDVNPTSGQPDVGPTAPQNPWEEINLWDILKESTNAQPNYGNQGQGQ